jgi:hypothetical protein
MSAALVTPFFVCRCDCGQLRVIRIAGVEFGIKKRQMPFAPGYHYFFSFL